MNEYQEALRLLKLKFSQQELRLMYDILEPLEELVDKATPTKPLKYPDVFLGKICCPNCEKEIGYTMQNYCLDCGQAIDWEEE